jgi:YgiT-type zinc finger domain-containing protein
LDRYAKKEEVEVIPERCTFCKGTLQEGKTEFIARVGDEIIVIRDVPAYVCDRCGEAYYSAEISRKIDAVMKDAHLSRQARLNSPGKERDRQVYSNFWTGGNTP